MSALPSPSSAKTSPNATSLNEAEPPAADVTAMVLLAEPAEPGATLTTQFPLESVVADVFAPPFSDTETTSPGAEVPNTEVVAVAERCSTIDEPNSSSTVKGSALACAIKSATRRVVETDIAAYKQGRVSWSAGEQLRKHRQSFFSIKYFAQHRTPLG